MTLPESFSIIYSSGDLAFSALALYLSVVSGYLIVAYMAGSKLTTMQLSIISGLFTVFAGMLAFLVFTFIRGAIGLMASSEGYDTGGYAIYTPHILAAILVVGIVSALKFMFDTRKDI